MKRKIEGISIIGAFGIRPGEHWTKSLEDMSEEAIGGALLDADTPKKQIDTLFVANTLMENLDSVSLDLDVPTFVVSGCAAGGLAMHAAINSLLTGESETAMVLGAEKMTDLSATELASALMKPGSVEEQIQGFTQPALYAIIARKHMEKYGTTLEQLAAVAVKNHEHGALNPKAQFQKPITLEMVMRSHKVADPLRVFDCSPISSDGAAAIILTNRKRSPRSVEICASSVGSDSIGLDKRSNILSMKATKKAAQRVFEQAEIGPADLDLAEVHDAFTISEIMAMEDLSIFEEGQAARAISLGKTRLGSTEDLVVNSSGGLKANGNPVGATGVYQVVEVVTQLRGEAGRRQVPNARIGLTHNVSGTGTTAIHILRK